MEGEIREKSGWISRVYDERKDSKHGGKKKKGLHDGLIVLTIMYVSETWVWNERQRSRIQVVEMRYLRRMDGESNESVYNRFGMSSKGEGMKCRVVKGVKCNTLRWFGNIERMAKSEMTKKVYMSMVDVVRARGQPPVQWGDKVLQYVRERKERRMRRLEHESGECKRRNKWKLLCCGHH